MFFLAGLEIETYWWGQRRKHEEKKQIRKEEKDTEGDRGYMGSQEVTGGDRMTKGDTGQIDKINPIYCVFHREEIQILV